MVRLSKPLGRIEDRAARFGERKLYRICWQTIFVSEIRQAVDTVRICLVSRTFPTPTGAASVWHERVPEKAFCLRATREVQTAPRSCRRSATQGDVPVSR